MFYNVVFIIYIGQSRYLTMPAKF